MSRIVTPKQRINHLIKSPEVRVIGAEGEQLGILKTSEALRQARDGGYDLVEVAPTAEPPVCRIISISFHLTPLVQPVPSAFIAASLAAKRPAIRGTGSRHSLK